MTHPHIVNDDDVDWLCDQLTVPEDCELSAVDKNLIHYVSGGIGRSVARVKKCSECKVLLVDTECHFETDYDIDMHIN